MTTVAEARASLASRGLTPATLCLAEAAAYVGLSKRTFMAEVAAGKMPPPLDLAGRRKLFSKVALDQRVSGRHAQPTRDEIDAAMNAAIDAYDPRR